MSSNERKRLVVLAEVKERKLTLAVAAEVLGLSYRQVKRVWKRFEAEGDAGLVHRSRGRPSLRAMSQDKRRQIIARYRERYSDFGPTLAAEHLAQGGLGSGSRNVAALAHLRRDLEGRATAAEAPPMA